MYFTNRLSHHIGYSKNRHFEAAAMFDLKRFLLVILSFNSHANVIAIVC